MAILKDMTDKEALPGSFNLHTFIFFPGFFIKCKNPSAAGWALCAKPHGAEEEEAEPWPGSGLCRVLDCNT